MFSAMWVSINQQLMPSWAVTWQSSEIQWTSCFCLMLLIHDMLKIVQPVNVFKMYLNIVYCHWSWKEYISLPCLGSCFIKEVLLGVKEIAFECQA